MVKQPLASQGKAAAGPARQAVFFFAVTELARSRLGMQGDSAGGK